MEKLNAQQLFDKLLNEDGLIGKSGYVQFVLNNLQVRIKSKDSVGNLLQEWLKSWLTTKGIEHRENPNRQAFPDFFLDLEDDKKGLLEVKTFDIDRGPGFDIANFDSYSTSLIDRSYRLDSDYLIFAYQMDENGLITIVNIWLKKIWEIAGPSSTYPLKVQEKKQIIYNIRPVIWYSERATYSPFNSKESFLSALNETRYQYSATRAANNHWLQRVLANYRDHSGVLLAVSR